MRRKPLFIILGLLVVVALVWFFTRGTSTENIQLTAVAKRGEFISTVTSSGELKAKQSTQIRGPREARQYRINEMKVEQLIPEGTVVKKGDFVGRLDKSQISNSEKDLLNELDKTESQYIQAKLDTALELRGRRDEIKNLKFSVEERKIEVKYSEFEPPAVQRQAQINLEKAERAYKNGLESYQLKKRQSVAKVREVGATLAIQKNNLDNLHQLMNEFIITAPQDGMIIYSTDWGGNRIKAGSQISSWNPVIAELPDMSVMISRTSINEVDISKIKVDQPVLVGIDAFPDLKFKAKVTYVANVGSGGDAGSKNFEVTIELIETDSILRPGMTTSNEITVFTEQDAVSIPLEAVYTQDSITYVVVKDGLSKTKKEVKVGKGNDVEIIILEGLKEGEEVFLTLPEGIEEKPITMLKE
ncbi:MAG: efflux RND transporter periplasmic adaptor subunit [Bacteroidetes bacterium]|nr:efflux RND transporter periplasmic adaptor subunit [Bacteroidota bacterium]